MTNEEKLGSHTETPEKAESSVYKNFMEALTGSGILHPDEWPIRRMLGAAMLLLAGLVLVAVLRQGVARVHGGEVGVQVNNLTGELSLRERAGIHVFVPYLSSFYVFDRTIQKLELTWERRSAHRTGDVKLRTSDGNDVSLDVVVNYHLIPERAVEILRMSGASPQVADAWMEPFVRDSCFSAFGALATEDMYDAGKRAERSRVIVDDLNRRLNPFGYRVIAVIPGEFRFYREYEEVIQAKKLADQEVEEQQAQARASLEDQERQVVVAERAVDTRLTSARGEAQNQIIRAQTDMARQRSEADGAHAAALLNADGEFVTLSKQAEGLLATGKSDARGMERMRLAMEGPGGVTMVGLEYAKRLGETRMTASPMVVESLQRQLRLESDGSQGGNP